MRLFLWQSHPFKLPRSTCTMRRLFQRFHPVSFLVAFSSLNLSLQLTLPEFFSKSAHLNVSPCCAPTQRFPPRGMPNRRFPLSVRPPRISSLWCIVCFPLTLHHNRFSPCGVLIPFTAFLIFSCSALSASFLSVPSLILPSRCLIAYCILLLILAY